MAAGAVGENQNQGGGGSCLKKKRLAVVSEPFFLGAENEIRTRDPQLGKLMLYQLSYFRLLVA